jgi:hypothetical protein
MTAPDTPEPVHDWRDVAFWRAELRRKPPGALALAGPLWRRAVIYEWLMAAGAGWSCSDRKALLPPDLPDCPALRALRHAARELEQEEAP